MLTPRFVDALAHAFELHQEQFRKQTEIPYISHLMSVSALVLEDGGDEDEAIAALLHDAAEDQGGTPVLEEIRRRFGDRVAGIVAECSDSMTEDPAAKAPWVDRKRDYLAHVEHKSSGALRVTAADKLHNARAVLADYRVVGEELWQRFSGAREGTLWYYRALADRLAARCPDSRLVAELGRTVTELERRTAR
ncbi:MAG: HD domain-containing protein [Vicinamibacteria bacterium]|nr:HD domain-containing protein [Vicinamibacteria bacterium]